MKKCLVCLAWFSLSFARSQYCLAAQDELVQVIPIVEKSEVWINPGLLSYHFDSSRGFNALNYGLGIEYKFSSVSSLTAGTYRNSYYSTSNYIGVYWQPFAIGPATIGIVLGGFDGYSGVNNGGWFPAALPAISIEGDVIGINLLLIPTIPNHVSGALSFQLKLKVFD